MVSRSRVSGRSAADSHAAAWPNYVSAMSACLVGGVIGDRIGEFLYWPFDKVARIVNGMEPLPMTFENAWRKSAKLPQDWWLVIAISLVFGVAFSICAAKGVEKRWRSFLLLLGITFLIRFVVEGHLPLNGFTGYGVAHYSVYQIAFLMENLLICGLAWQAARLGWYLTQERT